MGKRRDVEYEADILKKVASLKHACFVKLFWWGTTPADRPAIVMEFVDGPSLFDYVRDCDGLRAFEFIEIFGPVRCALDSRQCVASNP